MTRRAEQDESWVRLQRRVAGGGYEDLSLDERRWYCVRTLLETIRTDGIRGYFEGPGADRLEDCKEALRAIGGGAMPNLLSLIAKFFPFGVPQDADSRKRFMQPWRDDPSMMQMIDPVEEQARVEANFVEKKLAEYLDDCGVVD